ncbi:type II toxin-antitoxin system VapB family antitoxin [Gordonia sp. (in: high G+C Gram-positive bacteria)]|uniref:type II toxin-antitoxin system VapB family antitoxin n=1 Tax=Gordonia sp. (in: high G+C Gram-positive bacteria) TaxID=84139 RepID=UPI003F9CF0D9
MIFKGVHEGRPYPDHGLSPRDWAKIPPRQFRLDQLTTVTTVLALDKLLAEDSTFYGDLFAHIVQFENVMYLEDGLHRAVRSALRNRPLIHARLFDLDDHLARFGAVPGADDSGVETTAPLQPVSAPFAGTARRARRAGAHRLPE